jgi:signal transduction histidine kinase
LVGKDRKISSVTPQLQKLLERELKGLDILDLVETEEEKQKLESLLLQVVEQNTRIESQGHHFTSGAQTIPFTLCCVLLPEGVLIQLEDRRLHEELEGQLAQSQKMEAIGQLAAGVAHEINTPMQYVGDNLEFLSGAVTDLFDFIEKLASQCEEESYKKHYKEVDFDYLLEEMPLALQQAREGVTNVTRIVRSLKSFAHPGQGIIAPTDLPQMIDDAVTVAKNEWKYVADVETEYAPSLPEVPCNIGEMSQVILNMVINAAHAIGDANKQLNRDQGKIKISVTLEATDAVITIEDNGMGVPVEIREKIFDPFFTTKEVGVGTGQGLSIAYRVVVDRHGGKIDLDSGEGYSKFIIQLPLKQGE